MKLGELIEIVRPYVGQQKLLEIAGVGLYHGVILAAVKFLRVKWLEITNHENTVP